MMFETFGAQVGFMVSVTVGKMSVLKRQEQKHSND